MACEEADENVVAMPLIEFAELRMAQALERSRQGTANGAVRVKAGSQNSRDRGPAKTPAYGASGLTVLAHAAPPVSIISIPPFVAASSRSASVGGRRLA